MTVAFHDDVLTLALHARNSADPNTRDAAQRILTYNHAFIPEPARTEWAEAVTYGDGETRYLEEMDEEDARKHAAHTNAHEARGSKAGETGVFRAAAVFREVRMLVDGTQIIGPWMAPADQFTERP
ncbi:hypothetical protein [Verrucosispora sp. NA02020]|uniref:hypothetical protein n=1 Tax=Verrucosispora sp. NA02020 TaxID=2742132 RepID=UPI001591F7B2|nr:hypothetical protein [Verrucosispora sp. NA02020]QKW15417.1 hypothetical protein HUT12_23395 [Verrucosispora sp. NA02020]